MNEPTQQKEPQAEPAQAIVPVPAAAVTREPMQSGGAIAAIVPRDHAEAFRFAEAFVHGGMIPPSYTVKRNAQGKEVKEWEDGVIDEKATKARLAIGIMKGMEIGLPPITAVSTIAVINNRPCLWGDGAVALVWKSGKCKSVTDKAEGDFNKGTYSHSVTVQRVDSPEPITRTFSFADAKAAGLIGKKGPWSSGYGPRMCFNRARAWALRDAFSDVLLGIGIAEEVQDIPVEPTESKVDISSLDDAAPAALEAPAEKPAAEAQPDPNFDWMSVLDELKRGLSKCDSMAEMQKWWLDHIETIQRLQEKAPPEIVERWATARAEREATFTKKK